MSGTPGFSHKAMSMYALCMTVAVFVLLNSAQGSSLTAQMTGGNNDGDVLKKVRMLVCGPPPQGGMNGGMLGQQQGMRGQNMGGGMMNGGMMGQGGQRPMMPNGGMQQKPGGGMMNGGQMNGGMNGGQGMARPQMPGGMMPNGGMQEQGMPQGGMQPQGQMPMGAPVNAQ